MTSRRTFLKSMGSFAALASIPFGSALANNVRINIVGGGVAGTRAAAYLKMMLPSATILLFDPVFKDVSASSYTAIQGQYRPVSKVILKETGIEIVTEKVVNIDPSEKSVILENGKRYRADILVVAPGVDFKWDEIDGYHPDLNQSIIHAWQHPNNENVLWHQIASMRDGDNVVISAPLMPYRFPQGPYQRAIKIAAYLSKYKPASKVLILDSNDQFPSMQKYQQHWRDKVEWVSTSDGGRLESVDFEKNVVYTAADEFNAGVLNLIPGQRARQIATQSGLAVNSDWCQVDADTLESLHYQQVYVVGDANDADLMNKTAAAADEQAVRCALSIKSVVV